MPHTPSSHQLRSLVRRSISPVIFIQRNSKRPKLLRQILLVLFMSTVLMMLLFIYSTYSKSRNQAVFVNFSDDVPVVIGPGQVKDLFQRQICAQFQRPDPRTPPEKECQAPAQPFETGAFLHRPSGSDLLEFSRILLIVLFNHPHAETIPFVEMMYRPHFAHIVYCLPEGVNNPEKLQKSDKADPVFDRQSHDLPLFRILNSSFFMNVDIVTYPQPFMNRMAGENNYACFVEVSRRLLLAPKEADSRKQLKAVDFDGILVTADDLLIHVWNLAKPGYDPAKPWLMDRPMRVFDVQAQQECAVEEPAHDDFDPNKDPGVQEVAATCEKEVDWQWFRLYSVEMGEFSNEMEKYALETRLFAGCHHRLRESLGGQSRRFIGNGGAGDFYYVPRNMFLQAHDVLSLMAAHNVFVEIAVPTALRCLVANASTDIIHIQGEGMNWAYAKSRDRPWSAYSAASSLILPYYHPLKVAELLTFKSGLQQNPHTANRIQDLSCFICKTVWPKFAWFREYVANNNTPPVERPPWL